MRRQSKYLLQATTRQRKKVVSKRGNACPRSFDVCECNLRLFRNIKVTVSHSEARPEAKTLEKACQGNYLHRAFPAHVIKKLSRQH